MNERGEEGTRGRRGEKKRGKIETGCEKREGERKMQEKI